MDSSGDVITPANVLQMIKSGQVYVNAPAKTRKARKPTPEEPIYCRKDKLAIVGTADTMPATPFDDPEFEIWAVAQCTTFPAFKRADILFELHTEDYWKDPNVLTRLNKWTGPMVMQDHYKEVPNSVKFPLETILKYRRYHTTSITYMLALAYHSFLTTQKPVHVSLCGVHMEAREEYTTQRPACEYWLGRMEASGMDIFLTGGAILQSQGLYGYENYNKLCYAIRKRIEGLQAGYHVRQEEENTALLKKHEQQGAILEAEYWLRLAQTGGI